MLTVSTGDNEGGTEVLKVREMLQEVQKVLQYAYNIPQEMLKALMMGQELTMALKVVTNVQELMMGQS